MDEYTHPLENISSEEDRLDYEAYIKDMDKHLEDYKRYYKLATAYIKSGELTQEYQDACKAFLSLPAGVRSAIQKAFRGMDIEDLEDKPF